MILSEDICHVKKSLLDILEHQNRSREEIILRKGEKKLTMTLILSMWWSIFFIIMKNRTIVDEPCLNDQKISYFCNENHDFKDKHHFSASSWPLTLSWPYYDLYEVSSTQKFLHIHLTSTLAWVQPINKNAIRTIFLASFPIMLVYFWGFLQTWQKWSLGGILKCIFQMASCT